MISLHGERITKFHVPKKNSSTGCFTEMAMGFFLNCKGFNARVVCEWLRSLLQKIKLAPPFGVILDDRMDLCEVAMMLAIIMAIILVSFMCS